MPDDERYSLTELADLAGVTPRTVRYYIGQGLLPSVGQSGPGSKYDSRHLDRLRLIKRLQREHLPLAEIRRRTSHLAEDDIKRLAGDADTQAPVDSALDYVRSVLGQASRPAPAAPRLMETSGLLPHTSSSPVTASRQGARSQWERIALTTDIELHIRRPLDRADNKQVERLVTIARELFEEEPS